MTLDLGSLPLSVLDLLPCPLALVSRKAKVYFMNQAFHSELNKTDDLNLTELKEGELFLSPPVEQDRKRIQALLDQCLLARPYANFPSSHTLRIDYTHLKLDQTRHCVLTFNPIASGNYSGGEDEALVLCLFRSNASFVQLNPMILKELYKLTNSESRVAIELCSGNTLSVIARVLKVQSSTVKTHLQNVFRKTETRRQVELVKLLLNVESIQVHHKLDDETSIRQLSGPSD